MLIGNRTVYDLGTVKAVLSNLEVDADGSPRAYPVGSGLIALDYLANAGHPGNWWGIVTDYRGLPYIQGHSDPFPGYYVSTTSLQDVSKSSVNPNRYVNSETVPFVVIPSRPELGIELGYIGFAFNIETGDSSEFIVADIGPANKIGEASIKLANNLHINSNAKTGGTDKPIVLYVFFDSSKLHWPTNQILSSASTLFKSFGGITKLKKNLPSINLSKF